MSEHIDIDRLVDILIKYAQRRLTFRQSHIRHRVVKCRKQSDSRSVINVLSRIFKKLQECNILSIVDRKVRKSGESNAKCVKTRYGFTEQFLELVRSNPEHARRILRQHIVTFLDTGRSKSRKGRRR